MDYSSYQLAVFNWIKAGIGKYAAVDSVAGSGKSFTGEKGMAFVPEINKITSEMDMFASNSANKLFTCFNVTIRDELKLRMKHLPSVEVNNYNSLGWGACLKASRKIVFQKDEKTENILKFKVLGQNGMLSEENFKLFVKIVNPIKRLVSLFKGMCCFDVDSAIKALPELLIFHDLEVPSVPAEYERFVEILSKVYELAINTTYFMDFDDQIFQPLRMGWTLPQYDFIMVDEYQDTNDMQATMMQRCLRPDGRMMVFGDDDQCIYEFRGAIPDTMKNWLASVDGTRLPLSICYRCPITVVKEAQKVVPRIEWAPDAKQGYVGCVKESELMQRVQDRDFILCRTTAPLIRRVIKLLKAGKRASVKGRDGADTLYALISKIVASGDDNMDISEFSARLTDYSINQSEILSKLHRDKALEALSDKVEQLNALLDECNRVSDLKNRINGLFSEHQKEGIQAMTVHKSKGLQNPNVWIEEPGQLADGWNNKRPWQIGSQRRLRYVAHTRSQDNLFFVEKK